MDLEFEQSVTGYPQKTRDFPDGWYGILKKGGNNHV